MKRLILLTSSLAIVAAVAALGVSSAGASSNASWAKAQGKKCHCQQGPKGPKGTKGPKGPKGATGAQGAAGAAGPSNASGGVQTFNALLVSNFQMKSVTIGKFTWSETADGAAKCTPESISSGSTKAHVAGSFGADPNDPFGGFGIPLTASSAPPFTFTVSSNPPSDFLAVTDDGSSEMIGKSVFCSNSTTPSVTGGVLYGV